MRSVEISAFEARVSLQAERPRGEQPRVETDAWLVLKGLADEPVNEVRTVHIHLYAEERKEVGSARPPSVGAIIQTRPEVSAVVGLQHLDFDRIWSLATGGHLKHAHLVFTKPRRNKALVLSISFSTHPEE
jgi:hypothetical protein